MPKIEWKPYRREDFNFELLEGAADVIDAAGSVPVAVTLARAGAQYFSARLRAKKEKSALEVIEALMRKHYGASLFYGQSLQAVVAGRANTIRHPNRDDESAPVELSHEHAMLTVICGMNDAFKVTGRFTPRLVAFWRHQSEVIAKWLAASDPEDRMNRRAKLPKMWEELREWGTTALGPEGVDLPEAIEERSPKS